MWWYRRLPVPHSCIRRPRVSTGSSRRLLLPWIGDVAAYFTGLLCGRHKIIPDLSPKKSAEGCVGGLLGSTAFFLLWVRLALPGGGVRSDAGFWVFLLVTGLIGGVAAQAGDWFASAVKRWRGVKDFGSILPGHGGVLDRFDSVLFTLPVVYAASLLYTWI